MNETTQNVSEETTSIETTQSVSTETTSAETTQNVSEETTSAETTQIVSTETTSTETTQNISTETTSAETTLAKEARQAPEPRDVALEQTSESSSETTTSSESSSDTTATTSSEDSSETTSSTIETTATITNNMSVPFIGLSVLQCIIAFLLITVVLQQSKNATGITSSSMVGGDSQSYWNKNKGRSKESKLIKTTIVLGIIFFITTVALGFVK